MLAASVAAKLYERSDWNDVSTSADIGLTRLSDNGSVSGGLRLGRRWTGGEPFQRSLGPWAQARWRLSNSTHLSLALSAGHRTHDERRDRDGWRIAATQRLLHTLNSRTSIAVEPTFELVEAKTDHYGSRLVGLGATISRSFEGRWTVDITQPQPHCVAPGYSSAATQGRSTMKNLAAGDTTSSSKSVCTRTDLADRFTHVNERGARVADFQISLAAVLVAQSCNIGFEPMIRSDIPALRRDRLSWVSQNFIRNETLRAANAKLVASHDALPIVRLWGSGDVASADGVRFIVRGQPIHAGYNPKYFGRKRGVTWYNLVSDQSTGLGGVSVPGTLRDSMVILGLLLEQETHSDPREVMADTAAYSDVVFGLFWVLGYRFSPRLADIGGARFWRIDHNADYDAFDRLARNQIDTERIAAAWPDLLRLAGSLKLGRVKADAVMRIFQVKERPTPLARALAELGRIVKTIHVLDYVNDAEKRRRILVQLNHQQYRHRLARRVCHGRRGELIAGYREGQEEKLGALGLMLNVIAFWNATYMQAVVENLQAHGRSVNPAELARVSPLAHRHINFLGRYAFTLPETVARGELRPLRDPSSE